MTRLWSNVITQFMKLKRKRAEILAVLHCSIFVYSGFPVCHVLSCFASGTCYSPPSSGCLLQESKEHAEPAVNRGKPWNEVWTNTHPTRIHTHTHSHSNTKHHTQSDLTNSCYNCCELQKVTPSTMTRMFLLVPGSLTKKARQLFVFTRFTVSSSVTGTSSVEPLCTWW